MRHTTTMLLLGLTALAGVPAHADQRIEAPAFSLALTNHSLYSPSMTVLSNDGGTTRIGLTNFDAMGGKNIEVRSSDYDSYVLDRVNWADAELAFDVRDGYRVTSVTLSGTLTGVLAPAVLPVNGTPGVATNLYSMAVTFRQNDEWISTGSRSLTDVNGDQMLQLGSDISFAGDFTMQWDSMYKVEAGSGTVWWWTGDMDRAIYYPSFASAQWHDTVLTVNVAPVPEPSTWGMMLAGAALLGVVARRRAA